jgi:prostatic aicd phosphatase
VLGNTATAFLQGFYPPSDPATAATLTNGTAQFNPLDGYQYALVNGMTATAPDSIWIKGDQYCPAMTNASKAYYQSEEFLTRQQQLQPFYDKFTPLLAGIFPTSQIGFQSAYGIFDYLNVGYQHNSTIYSSLSTDDLFQLRTLADQQELALVYNPNAPATSIGGQTLGGAILQQLNKTVSGTDRNIKVTYFAASYSVFQALWGITGLVNSSANFQGLPDYASVMSFELRKTSSSDLFVRFGFRNGTSDNTNMTIYPLFGRPESDPDTPWFQFVVQMEKLGIFSPGQWCHACVNSNQTFCAAYPMYTGRLSGSSEEEMGGLSNVDAGAMGAGVTVAVILGIEGFLALWYVRKRKAGGGVGEKALSDTSSDRVAFA